MRNVGFSLGPALKFIHFHASSISFIRIWPIEFLSACPPFLLGIGLLASSSLLYLLNLLSFEQVAFKAQVATHKVVSAQETMYLPELHNVCFKHALEGFGVRPSVHFEDRISICWWWDSRTFCPVFCSSSCSKESSSWNPEKSPSLLWVIIWSWFCSGCCPFVLPATLSWAIPGPALSYPVPQDVFRERRGCVQDTLG